MDCSGANFLLISDGTDQAIFNKTINPTTLNLNSSPDNTYLRGLLAVILEFGWTRTTFVCPSPTPENGDLFPTRLCAKADAIETRRIAAGFIDFTKYSWDGLFLPTPNASGNVQFDTVLDNKILRTGRGKPRRLSNNHISSFGKFFSML
jgi:hypothetical protein